MKSVLISTRPKLVEKICHKIGEDETGKAIYEKRIEVRKTAPQEVPFKAYIYESRNGGHRCKHCNEKDSCYSYAPKNVGCYNGSGKVIGEFICDKVDKIMTLQHTYYNFLGVPLARITEYGIWNDDLPQMCLTKKEIEEYGKGKTLYGWHISDLKIYDKPRELSEFSRPCSYSGLCFSCKRTSFKKDGNLLCNTKITRPPQSWMYVEDLGEEK